MDTETKRYVDANMRAVKAENSASFAQLGAKIDAIPISPNIWQILAAPAATAVGIFSILAFAGDRFDGGISAYGLLDEYRAEQIERDRTQDARLDRILNTLEGLNDKPEGGPTEGQD